MKNADLFKQIFNIYATELWSMPEKEFLEWLNKNAVPAIPISVIEQIKAEIKAMIDWHDCPMELDNGNDAWYCEACNRAISIIDKHIKEFTE